MTCAIGSWRIVLCVHSASSSSHAFSHPRITSPRLTALPRGGGVIIGVVSTHGEALGRVTAQGM